MKKKIIIKEEDWKDCHERTVEWEQSVDIKNWTHDYMEKIYIIVYEEIEQIKK